jgi:methylase of polypeptide subunit release factors
MPVEPTPLFRQEVLRSRVGTLSPDELAPERREVIARWVALLSSVHGGGLKETELLPEFFSDVFHRVLGYSGPTGGQAGGSYTLRRERLVEVDGKVADGAIGTFGPGQDRAIAVVEGKGPKDPLDRPFAGRRRSAVEQAYGYAINLPCNWIIVTNLREIRLYHKGHTYRAFERFELRQIAEDEREFRRFVFTLGATRVVLDDGTTHLDALLGASRAAGEALTQHYYKTYAALRRRLLTALLEANPDLQPPEVLTATQRVLDRVLFVAFAEDRELLPANSLRGAFEHRDPYHPRPVWQNFLYLFKAIDQGSDQLGIPRYNGGLFAHDKLLDEVMVVPDAACGVFKDLGEFRYHNDDRDEDDDTPIVDVDILGHIFEQSIEDLEGLRAEVDQDTAATGPSRRQREGAFYTPQAVTSLLVERALRPVMDARFQSLLEKHRAAVDGDGAGGRLAAKALHEPAAYDAEALKPSQRTALISFWREWIEELQTIRVLDPACGSGAFLVEAFDQLHREYEMANEHLATLTGGRDFFDPDRTILERNLFGVDLNPEAVEVCRLSIWIKTARRGKVLADLDENIRVGNSIVSDPAVDERAFDWETAFPAAHAAGGFDVVVGNPPYVRAELLGDVKGYLEAQYASYHGTADLYVYFYELGVRRLRPGGMLSFIVTNKWLLAPYGEPLRRFLSSASEVVEVINLGHAKRVFPDADVFPVILVTQRPDAHQASTNVRVAVVPRDMVDLAQLPTVIRDHAFGVVRAQLGPAPWVLQHPEVAAVHAGMREVGTPLVNYVGGPARRGLMTGLNKAYLLDTVERDALVREDPGSVEILKPYLRGEDVGRWRTSWAGEWLLDLRSSQNRDWPWTSIPDAMVAEATFAKAYPGAYRRMKGMEEGLRGRTDQGRFWWELRSCGYYDEFEAPKLIWKDIAYHSSVAYDREGLYANNLCYFLPTNDPWPVAVLNSPAGWSYLWQHSIHGKDEALRLQSPAMEPFPIPALPEQHAEAAHLLLDELAQLTRSRAEAVTQWVEWLRTECGVAKAGERLSRPEELVVDEAISEIKKRQRPKVRWSTALLAHVKGELSSTAALRQELGRRVVLAEAQLADIVHGAYGLTDAELALLLDHAPPRTPIGDMVLAGG